MAITLATCMLWSRASQVASSLIILTSNGFLIHLISSRRLGLAARMIAIQNMAAVILFYTLISILVLHICHKSAVTNYLIGSIIWDLVFTGVCIGMISVYSIAGVPANCGGLTRQNWSPGDAPNNPHEGFTTVRFGQGLFGAYGELDVYCSLPITDFAFVIVLIFSYTLNIILSVLRILSFHYTHTSEVNKLCAEAELKGKGSFSDLASLITRVSSHHAPSVRTPYPASPSSPAPSFHSSPILPHPHAQMSPFHSSPISNHPPAPMSNLYLADDVDESDVADGLVSDGSRGGVASGTNNPPPYMPDLEAYRPAVAESLLGMYGKDQEFPGLQ